MTWAQAAAFVWGRDGSKELPTGADADEQVRAAANELGFDVQHEPDDLQLILYRQDEEIHISVATIVRPGRCASFVPNWPTLPQCSLIPRMTGTKQG